MTLSRSGARDFCSLWWQSGATHWQCTETVHTDSLSAAASLH